MRLLRNSTQDAVVAAIAFVVVAIGTTAIIRVSGELMLDIGLYRQYGDAMESGLVPYRDFDVEYPPGALPLFLLPSLLTAGSDQYNLVFAALMALLGAAGVVITGVSMRRLGRSRRTTRRVLVLLALSPVLLGGVLLTRFDLAPATVVAGATALLLARRHRLAAVLLGVAVAIKLYPLVLLPVIAAWAWRRHGRREVAAVAGLVVGVAAIAYAPFLVLSPGGVADSLGGQLGRPLQIESLGAGILFVLHNAAGLSLETERSHGSDNVAGDLAGAFALVLSALQVAALVWLWIRYARGQPTMERTLRYMAAVLIAFIVFGKVLSPQFLVWLLFAVPLVAARRGAAAGALYGVATLATAIWFPALYHELLEDEHPALSLLVVLRGLALVAALVVLAWPMTVLRAATVRAGPRSRSPSPSRGRR
jgi:hypothetical protein